jgi:hypothetical protein
MDMEPDSMQDPNLRLSNTADANAMTADWYLEAFRTFSTEEFLKYMRALTELTYEELVNGHEPS